MCMIFQKQNRKSTRAKYTFFLNGNQVANSTEYSYLGIIFNSNGSFSISKQLSAEKTRRSIFGAKRYLEFNNLPVAACNKRIDALFLPILLYSSEVWGAYDRTDAKKQQKDPIEKIHTHFYKHSIGLNRRATNIISRNEAGRLSLKSKININVIKLWLHLTSTAKQCLLLSCCLFKSS